MKTKQDKKFKSRSLNHGRLCFGVMVVFSICISVGNAGIGRLGGGITAFASIFVNDREIDIDNAVITIDGQPAVQADLKLGQVVLIQGDFDEQFPSGIATKVIVEDTVEGPITSIDPDNNQFVVLGQLVFVDVLTVFDIQSGSNLLEDLEVQDQAEVFGFLTAEGDILATRVVQRPSGGPLEVTGVVSDLTATTFAINALTVDFFDADLDNFPTDIITEGDFVEAKGVSLGANGELLATSVELRASVAGNDGELGEFEGLITEFDSSSAFSVGRISVVTYTHTVFEGGGPGNLANNVNVEVEGRFDEDGVLIADTVIIRGTRIRIHAQVDSVADTSLTVLSITATVDSTTLLDDNSSSEVEPFGLPHLHSGDFVELRSFKNPATSTPFLAERVRREDPESEVRLQGFVDSVGSQIFDIHGVTIFVNPDSEYLDASEEEIDAAEFFDVLTLGTFVIVHGTESTNTGVIAAEVELHIDD